jgi:hypothetical protein
MKYLEGLRNSNPWYKTSSKGKSGQTMEESTPQMNLEFFAEMWGLRGISPLPIILNKMVWYKGRIEQLWKQ